MTHQKMSVFAIGLMLSMAHSKQCLEIVYQMVLQNPAYSFEELTQVQEMCEWRARQL